jgi:ABC-2 type transport system permease protein
MGEFFREIKKHLLLYLLFAKSSLIAQLEYRANFFITIGVETCYLFSKLLYVIVVFQLGVRIKGWTPDAILLFIGTFVLITAFYTLFFMQNFFNLPRHIREGTLDMYIVKPVSLQFIATLRQVEFAVPIPNVIGGTVMVVIAWNRLDIAPSFGNIAGYLGIIASGVLVSYAIYLMPQILSFWIVKTGALVEIADKGWDFNNMPMAIYSKWIQRVGMFVIPIFAIFNLPPMFLLKQLNTAYALWIFAAPAIFLFLNRKFWSFAVKHYSSASS